MADPLIDFALEEPLEQVEGFVRALEAGTVTLTSGAAQLRFEFIHGPRSLERMLAVLRTWRHSAGTADLLARVLRTQLEIRRAVENRGPRCELVWTGDVGAAAGIRSTLPLVMEMLQWATRSVVVVTYAMWIGQGETGKVVNRLAELSSAGVDVTFILDRRYQDGSNLAQLNAAWPRARRRPTVYSWQDETDDIAKLHAKVLIVDRRDLLISSANLTGHGMKRNLEFGLRVHGRPAEEAADHFDTLIRTGVFRPVAWSQP